MLNEDLPILWELDWGIKDFKNWAEKEKRKFQSSHPLEYGLFTRKLRWFQGQPLEGMKKTKDLERIGKDVRGHKINFRILSQTIRLFGSLSPGSNTFKVLLLIHKKSNQITDQDLKTFEDRIKKI